MNIESIETCMLLATPVIFMGSIIYAISDQEKLRRERKNREYVIDEGIKSIDWSSSLADQKQLYTNICSYFKYTGNPTYPKKYVVKKNQLEMLIQTHANTY